MFSYSDVMENRWVLLLNIVHLNPKNAPILNLMMLKRVVTKEIIMSLNNAIQTTSVHSITNKSPRKDNKLEWT